MNHFLLYLLTFLGLSFCALTTVSKNELLEPNLPLIDDTNTDPVDNNIEIQDHNSILLPLQFWCYFMDFVGYEEGQNLSLVCKTFHRASQKSKSLHRKRLQKWMSRRSSSCRLSLKNRLSIDYKNDSIEIYANVVLKGSSAITMEDHALLFTIILPRMNKLKLKGADLLNDIFKKPDQTLYQLPELKELTVVYHMAIHVRRINFYLIQSVFPNIDTLKLEISFNSSAIIPFTVEEVFSAIPQLKKLVIQISSVATWFDTRKDLISFLKVLFDKRIILKVETTLTKSNTAAMAFEIFDSELKKEDELYKMRERIFLYIEYEPNIPEIIYENAKQIHSIEFLIDVDINGSLDITLCNLERFIGLEKLAMFLEFNVGDTNLKLYSLKPFTNLTSLNLTCDSVVMKNLLNLQEIIFPNISVPEVRTLTSFDIGERLRFKSRQGLANLVMYLFNGHQ